MKKLLSCKRVQRIRFIVFVRRIFLNLEENLFCTSIFRTPIELLEKFLHYRRGKSLRCFCSKKNFRPFSTNMISEAKNVRPSDILHCINNIDLADNTSSSSLSLVPLILSVKVPLARSLCSLTGSFASLIHLSLILLLGCASPRFARGKVVKVYNYIELEIKLKLYILNLRNF